VPFAMYLVDLLRPASIVELGTRRGVSYCAFCQAVQRLGLGTKCVAIDSWSGDAHTGAYGAAVLAELRRHHDPLYGKFSRLEQTLFDRALTNFPNGSIDLLHIDGLHTYDAVRRDFETWLPRMSARGVMLFHDVTERRGDFGVWRLWSQLDEQYPSFQFRHGHGLGVLGVGNALPAAVSELLQLSEAGAIPIRLYFERQGRVLRLQTIVEILRKHPVHLVEIMLEWLRNPASRPVSGA